MAKGRQIYLQAEEIEHLAAMVEWKIVEIQNDRRDLIDSLGWAISDIRTRGPKPERADFDPRLPDPEVDYQAALERWERPIVRLKECRQDIIESRKDEARLKALLGKLYYYG